jgi:formiminoglutamase
MPPIETVEPISFFTRPRDPADPRLAELADSSAGDGAVAIVGYPDDEGIKLNGGRPGAAEGPKEIRRWLYRMTPHPRRTLKAFLDSGDLTAEAPLEERHEEARAHAAKLLESGRQVLSFGGGNDYAYSDGMAFLDQKFEQRPLIINIDAHLDVRDLSRGLNSGTPFFRLLESGRPFDFMEIGIQGQCNAQAHWDYVESKGGKILALEEIADSGLSLSDFVAGRAGDWLLKARPAFLAVDMDAFAWPYAQGTSAAWPLGLDPMQFHSFAQMICRRLNVLVYGIYEVSPPLDQGGGTARLAAQFAHGFLHHV